jgi:hypothetical protein
MGADKRIKGGRLKELQAGLSQLEAKDHGQRAGEQHQQNTGDGVLDADYFMAIVHAKVAGPGWPVLGWAVVYWGFFSFDPLKPVLEDADTYQESDSSDQSADYDNRFSFPGWLSFKLPDKHYQSHAKGGTDDLSD